MNFILETLLMAILPSIGFLAMAVLRGYHIDSEVFTEFSVLVLKFGILHLLLQFSGFYSNIFPPKK
jgi:putative Mn2+ efflux pump MntP